MPIRFKRKVLENNRSLWMNIPKPIVEELDLKKGDIISIAYDNGSFSVTKSEKD